MVPVLNKLDVRCSVFGNHDFDFGIDTLIERVEKTNFPWLMSNVIDNETGRPLADGKVTHIIDWCGRKIGLVRNTYLYILRCHLRFGGNKIVFGEFTN